MSEFSSFDKLVALRENEALVFDSKPGFWAMLAGFYPDNAHFIYELLQNAEDAQASSVEFDLEETRLVVTHDGKRPFTLDDIASITDIGNSTKKTDSAAIGQFGVGFKAVFAYTSRPTIRSGEYSFAIERRIVPVSTKAAPVGDKTVFTFPFDNPDKPSAQAYTEVARGLRSLRETTVLFLRHVHTINFRLTDGTTGRIARANGDYPFVSIQKQVDDQTDDSHWLRLVGDHQHSSFLKEGQSVAAAFRLDRGLSSAKSANGKRQGASVMPLEHGEVCVYFPAAKESGGLRFHIHAPFASPPARDSINEDHEGNEALIDAIGQLIAKSLPKLRDDGWITDGLLESLPNPDDQLVAPYTAIQERIVAAFWNERLTPVIKGGYEAASRLVSSPSEFRKALNAADLAFMLSLSNETIPSKPKWMAERRGRAQRFLAGLGVPVFGWQELEEIISRLSYSYLEAGLVASWREWLTGKPLEEVRALYELIGMAVEESHMSAYPLKRTPIIRVGVGRHAELVNGSRAFLPSDSRDTGDRRIPQELAYFDTDNQTKSKSRLASFYQATGVRRWNERSQVQARLEQYGALGGPGIEQHLEDLRQFVSYWKRHPKDMDLFENAQIFMGRSSDGTGWWSMPEEIYLDEPYQETGLSAFYGENPDKYRLADDYLGQVDGIIEFAQALGCLVHLVPIEARVQANPLFEWRWARVGRESSYSRNVDWALPVALDAIVNSGNSKLLGVLWGMAARCSSKYATAIYVLNNSTPTRQFSSQVAQCLSGREWILDQHGDLRTPESMTSEELPEGWPEPEPGSLALALNFGEAARQRTASESVRQKAADELGVSVELLDALDELPDDERRAFEAELIRSIRTRPVFPHGAPTDPKRREEVVGIDAAEAPEYETEFRTRRVAVGRSEVSVQSKQYLREQYTTEVDTMVCQACHEPMPFKINGAWYFEAVPFITKRSKNHFQNFLALCPLCAALFMHARTTDDGALLSGLNSIEISSESGAVSIAVILNSKRVELRFTGKHALDVRTVLAVAGGARTPN